METAVTDQIVLQVWHKNPDGTDGLCGYVGQMKYGRWPLVAKAAAAQKYTNMILAEGAANQYFAYLKIRSPARLPGSSVKYVKI